MRLFPKHAWLMVPGLVLVMAASRWGGTTSSGSTPTTASTFTVQTAQATVNGKTTTILTNARGLTLYYFTPDTASKTVCTGSCAQTWPPLLFTGTGKPTASTALPGE
jgi:predicted lipoprotein with Yx(FWY)xxD motif